LAELCKLLRLKSCVGYCSLQFLGCFLCLPHKLVVIGTHLVQALSEMDAGVASVFDCVRRFGFFQHFASTHFRVLHQLRRLWVTNLPKVCLAALSLNLHEICKGVNMSTHHRQSMANFSCSSQFCPKILLCVGALVHLIYVLLHHASAHSGVVAFADCIAI